MSIESLYRIKFESNQNNFGYGIAVFETGRIFGGDSSFIFTGNYELNNGFINATIACINDQNVLESIFGDMKTFNLKISGKLDDNHKKFTLTGNLVNDVNMTVKIELIRVANLP